MKKFGIAAIFLSLALFSMTSAANPFLGVWKFNRHTLSIHRNTYITFTQSKGWVYGTLSGGKYSNWNSFVGRYNHHTRKLEGNWKTHNPRFRSKLPGSFYFVNSRNIGGVFSNYKERVNISAVLIRSTYVPACKGGSKWNGSKCVCTGGALWDGKRCVCTGGSYWNVNKCVCAPGRHWNGSRCKKDKCHVERVCRTEKVKRCRNKKIGETCEYKKICKVRHGKKWCTREKECRPDYKPRCRYVDEQVCKNETVCRGRRHHKRYH
ncbi:MAG: hypothetical protein JXR95_14130 [Deltaproteobacteria bacterium]|nr:hypothetical protein [Deltaproteobacteria bacterium]